MLEFIIFFMLLTFISSFFIVGFYGITRHYIVVQPNGKETVEGYALKWYSYFIEKIVRHERLFYYNEPLAYKLASLKKMLPKIGQKFQPSMPDEWNCNSLITHKEHLIVQDEIDKIETILSCKLLSKKDGEFTYWFLYIDEPKYLFPSIIRKPLSQCVTCMSSVFGSLIWITINYLYNPFGWTNHKIFAFFVFFGIFVITLSKLNDLIFRKTI